MCITNVNDVEINNPFFVMFTRLINKPSYIYYVLKLSLNSCYKQIKQLLQLLKRACSLLQQSTLGFLNTLIK